MPLNPVPGTAGDDPALIGTAGDDRITAEAGNDTALGGLGNDLILGGLGNDLLSGGEGSDDIRGGDGDDTMIAGANGAVQSDALDGGNGDDVATFNTGNGGAALGGNGTDTLRLFWADAPATRLNFATGSDATSGATRVTQSGFERIDVTTGSGADTVQGGTLGDIIDVGAGANTVRGNGGDDQITYLAGAANQLSGGKGLDSLTVFVNGGVALGFDAAARTDGFGSTLTGFESFTIFAVEQNDTLAGAGGSDVFFAGNGDDEIQGRGGNDTIFAETGVDTISGGAGNDVIRGGLGADQTSGGAGSDSFFFFDGDLGDRITDFVADDDTIVIRNTAIGSPLQGGAVVTMTEGRAVTDGPEFVYDYDAATDTTTLRYDSNGRQTGGLTLILTMDGDIALTSADVQISS